jgi:hypothetical protein
MKKTQIHLLILSLVVASLIYACRPSADHPATPISTTSSNLSETPMPISTLETPAPLISAEAGHEVSVTRITLPKPLNAAMAELSSLTWAGDWLILLPQYPSKFDSQIYRISKEDILTYLQNPGEQSISMQAVRFVSGDVEKEISGFEGFESITSLGQDVYLTIESSYHNMTDYLVHGLWNEDYSSLTLSPDSLTEIPTQENISNLTYESVLVFGKRVVTLYEANGKNVNDQPLAQLFDLTDNFVQSLNFPQVEYRITDATQPDKNGLFWVINYFYPGDKAKLKPAEDPIADIYGEGETHQQSETVERLLAMQFSEDGIVLSERAPIQLELLPDDVSRNWEGIVQLDELGFLLVTDSHPETWFAFVPFPD